MTPSRTLQVSGAQLALIQPLRSRPLKSGIKSSGAAPSAAVAQISQSHAVSQPDFGQDHWAELTVVNEHWPGAEDWVFMDLAAVVSRERAFCTEKRLAIGDLRGCQNVHLPPRPGASP